VDILYKISMNNSEKTISSNTDGLRVYAGRFTNNINRYGNDS
jgi:hypothetical protein